jgi:hypothetical protein
MCILSISLSQLSSRSDRVGFFVLVSQSPSVVVQLSATLVVVSRRKSVLVAARNSESAQIGFSGALALRSATPIFHSDHHSRLLLDSRLRRYTNSYGTANCTYWKYNTP